MGRVFVVLAREVSKNASLSASKRKLVSKTKSCDLIVAESHGSVRNGLKY